MKAKRIPIRNYMKMFSGGQIFVSGCNEILKKQNEYMKKLCKPSMRKYYISGHSSVPVDLILKLSEKNRKIIYECFKAARFASRANAPHKLPKEISYDLAYIVGVLRDGSITSHDYSLRISQSGKFSREWLLKIRDIFKKEFGISGRISKYENENRFEVKSKPLTLFIRNIFEMPLNQKYWNTPKIIKKNKELWIPYVCGFFDAEGYCTSKKTFFKTGKAKIAFSQNNFDSLDFIKKVLSFYKINSSKVCFDKNKKCYSLYVQSKNDIINFSNIFKIVRKHSQLSELLTVIKDTKSGSFRNAYSAASSEAAGGVKH